MDDVSSRHTALSELRKGRVISVLSQEVVIASEGCLYRCVLRGALKKKWGEEKNLVVVGDFVLFTNNVIEKVCARFSCLSRQEHLTRQKQQLLAANIDQVLITVSAQQPPMKPALIDRYVIAAYKGNMRPILIINKIDLVSHRAILTPLIDIYEKSEVPVIVTSVRTGEGLDRLSEKMKGVASVFAGQSGVGKSSLINVIVGLNRAVGGLATKTGKGSHTTARAELIPLKGDGFCIDTPGIRSFGIWKMQREDLLHHFHEITALGRECHFPDCTHRHEPGCTVRAALERGELLPFRLDSYLKLLSETNEF